MRRLNSFLFIVLFGISCSVVAQNKPATEGNNTAIGFELLKNLDIYSSMIKELSTDYVDVINPGQLTQTGIDAMLESLDPYTNFIPENLVEDYRFITTGQYGGIGALIHQQGKYVVISEPYEGSPAQKSGLKAGDKIIRINGQAAVNKTYDEVSAVLKGQAGTQVNLVIERKTPADTFVRIINRENIKIDNVPYAGVLSDSIAYIKLTGFTQNASKEFRQSFMKLKENNTLRGLIIDIRGNGGGLLNEAVDIANLFVEKGQEIVSTKGQKTDKNQIHYTSSAPVDTEIPIVILVDSQSASASEILAGSIQDLDRGVVLGERTFGKGLVQNVVPLSFNAQMKITVAKYYIPSGRCIQAIDYSHKNKQGAFDKIPDSLIREFKTRHGRKVYDGGGISPDVKGSGRKISNIALALYNKFLIFDYGTLFERSHPSILPPDQFEITDSIYNDFLNFLKNKDYKYTTRSELALEKLRKEAEKEKYYEAIKGELDLLQTSMDSDKKEDLNKYRDQVHELLKMDILARYYYQKGKIIGSLKTDPVLNDALKVLKDSDRYAGILAGKYSQPDNSLPGSVEEELHSNDGQ
ncbi:MAG: S41 family peptidase [Bacteroidetes bacterium]|nr:S41 family peptidase [Bacteroidota bacterium]